LSEGPVRFGRSITGENIEVAEKDTKRELEHDAEKAREGGASMVEYSLVLLLVALIVLISIRVVGQTISNQFSIVASNL
jgi:Flp pilus assembly pilin Flp